MTSIVSEGSVDAPVFCNCNCSNSAVVGPSRAPTGQVKRRLCSAAALPIPRPIPQCFLNATQRANRLWRLMFFHVPSIQFGPFWATANAPPRLVLKRDGQGQSPRSRGMGGGGHLHAPTQLPGRSFSCSASARQLPNESLHPRAGVSLILDRAMFAMSPRRCPPPCSASRLCPSAPCFTE